MAGSWSCGGLKGRGQRLRPEEAAVATGAHGRLGVGAPRTRPLRPAGPAHCRSGLRAERADHRERAAWGSRGGRARAAPSFPLPSALGPRGPRRSEKMALHFQVSAPGCGPGAPAVAGGGGVPGRDPERAQPLARGRRVGGGLRSPTRVRPRRRGLQRRPDRWERERRGRQAAPTPSLRSAPSWEAWTRRPGRRERGSAGARLEDCHWPEAGGRVGARRGREHAASLEEPRGRARAALEGCVCLVAQALRGSSSHRRLRSLPTGVCTVAERSGTAGRHQLPPLSF